MSGLVWEMARDRGIEPPHAGLESAALPLY